MVDNPPPPSPPHARRAASSVGADAGSGTGAGIARTREGAPAGARSTGRADLPDHSAAGRREHDDAAAPVAENADNNARYRDTGRNMNISGGSGIPRPAPSQADISRVINNNRGGIKNCYQRALLRDNSLTHGKISVKVTIGISGRVKHTAIDGPPQFRALDPCIKEVVGRWAFPQASDEYGTEFVYVFQGNE